MEGRGRDMALDDPLRSNIFMIQANPAVDSTVIMGGTKESDGRTWVGMWFLRSCWS